MICPLSLARSPHGRECLKEKCAWWYEKKTIATGKVAMCSFLGLMERPYVVFNNPGGVVGCPDESIGPYP